jgi:SAM-dependent methyltransferase
VAEALPFAADSFDASLAVLTLHHWPDWRSGAAELRRVARRRAVVFTHDWAASPFLDFWLLRDYLPSLVEAGSKGAPQIEKLCTPTARMAASPPTGDGPSSIWKRRYARRSTPSTGSQTMPARRACSDWKQTSRAARRPIATPSCSTSATG